MNRLVFPFSAVVGQERVKQALLFLAVNPRIGGVLLCGEKGTAKSTLVRSLGTLGGVRLLELPLNITEDMLLGGVDLERAVRAGARAFQPGLLARADGGLLYADEINLLPMGVTGGLLDALESGLCRVERDGISRVCPARFALVGTMNPEEGALRPQLLDRFGLYVNVAGETDPAERKEVVRRLLAFEQDPVGFTAQWNGKERRLTERILRARAVLPQITLGDAEFQAACRLAQQANAAGHRAELAILQTAQASAAWMGRTYLNLDDLNTAAELALPHRRREAARQEPPRSQPEEDAAAPSERPAVPDSSPGEATSEATPQTEDQSGTPELQEATGQSGDASEQMAHGDQIYDIRRMTEGRADRLARRGSGRRNKTLSATRRGRTVRDALPHGKAEDLAVSATLRAAAPYQWQRQPGGAGKGLVILPSDFRVKVRESRMGADIVFAVDASGSMGAARRMKEVKDAVLSMLMDSYQKRDRVGMVIFRGGEAGVALDVTRSVELAQRELQALPTGGRTPLAAGIEQARCLLLQQRRRRKESLPLLVLVTDGRANFSAGGDPVEEALRAARRVAEDRIPAIVIDTEKQFLSLRLASEVARAMDAACYRMEDLRAQPLAELVRGRSTAEQVAAG